MIEAAQLARVKRAEVLALVAGTFARREAWVQAGKYVDGLLADLPRKNGWTLAEHAGDRSPERMQRLLNHVVWDDAAASAAVRDFVISHLADEFTVAVFDESALACSFQAQLTPGRSIRADHAVKLLQPDTWNHRSAGHGSKGERRYQWAWLATTSPRHHLLVRRSLTDPTELAYFYTWVPEGRPVTLPTLVRVAGMHWPVVMRFVKVSGNLLTTTEPKGNLTPEAGDFTTTNTCDEIYQLTSVTNANADKITYEYDNVGNVQKVVDPRKNATVDPADYTTIIEYDRAHRVTKTIDALGKTPQALARTASPGR